MKEINDKHSYENDKLSSLFKEVQDIRYGRAKPQPQTNFNRFDTSQIQFNKVYVVDKKFNALGVIIGILLLILFASILKIPQDKAKYLVPSGYLLFFLLFIIRCCGYAPLTGKWSGA